MVPVSWPGCQDLPPFLLGWSESSLDVLVFCWVWGVVLLCGVPSIHFNHMLLTSWGAETPVTWGRALCPRSPGQAWRTAPSLPVSSCPGPEPSLAPSVTNARFLRPQGFLWFGL